MFETYLFYFLVSSDSEYEPSGDDCKSSSEDEEIKTSSLLKQIDVEAPLLTETVVGATANNDQEEELLFTEPLSDAKNEDYVDVKKKKPSRPCIFCRLFQTRLTRHIKTVHKNEEQVKKIFTLPKKEQDAEFNLLRKQGIFSHNIKLLQSGKLEENMELERRPKKLTSKVKICVNCKACIQARYFYKHSKLCSSNTNPRDMNQNKNESKPHFDSGLASSLLPNLNMSRDKEFNDILNRFQPDEKGKLCQTNKFLISFGQHLYKKIKRRKGKEMETHKTVMRDMRSLAGIYFKFRELAPAHGVEDRLTVESMLDREYFQILEEAIERQSVDESKNLKSGTKLLIGTVLKRAITAYEGLLLVQKRDEEAKELERFRTLLHFKWDSLFAEAEYNVKSRREEALRRPDELPLEKDVKKVRDYIQRNIKCLREEYEKTRKLNQHQFVQLRNLAATRLTFFNARRGGEPSRILLEEWNTARTNQWIDRHVLESMSSEEKEKLLSNKVIYQGGKGNGQLVPVIVVEDLVDVLNILANHDIRLNCGVHAENKFLFPSTGKSLDHMQGSNSTSKVTLAAGVTRHLTATHMRHRCATEFAKLEMPEENRKFLYKHLGHSEEININVYQCPPAIKELTQVGSLLSILDDKNTDNSQRQSQNKSSANRDLVTNEIEDLSPTTSNTTASTIVNDLSSTQNDESTTSNSTISRPKKNKSIKQRNKRPHQDNSSPPKSKH